MATYYADSSVLVKRHITEIGTPWVQALTDPVAGHLFITSRASMVEVISALNRRQREGSLSTAEYDGIVMDFEALCATDYQLVELTEEVVAQARHLLEQHALRADDAVQLASALLTDAIVRANGETPLTFLAADDRLLTAAQLEGLAVDNPNQYLQLAMQHALAALCDRARRHPASRMTTSINRCSCSASQRTRRCMFSMRVATSSGSPRAPLRPSHQRNGMAVRSRRSRGSACTSASVMRVQRA